MVDFLFLGVMGMALSAALYARWYGRKIRNPKAADGRLKVSPSSMALSKLFSANTDFSPTIEIILGDAKQTLRRHTRFSGSPEDLKYLISICENAVKKKGNSEAFREIDRLYSRLDLEGGRNN